MSILGWVFVACCVALFFWVFYWPRKTAKSVWQNPEADQAYKTGFLTGVAGGSIAGAATAQYATSRVKKPSDTDTAIASVLSAGK